MRLGCGAGRPRSRAELQTSPTSPCSSAPRRARACRSICTGHWDPNAWGRSSQNYCGRGTDGTTAGCYRSPPAERLDPGPPPAGTPRGTLRTVERENGAGFQFPASVLASVVVHVVHCQSQPGETQQQKSAVSSPRSETRAGVSQDHRRPNSQ